MTLLASRYRLMREIGAGGMGTVWEAVDEQLQRMVAVKILHPDVALGPQSIERFQREALILAKLRHPGTVHIYEMSHARPGPIFIAMELLEGRSVAGALDSELIFSPERSVQIAAGALECLQEAHGQGVVHRDIKPSNLFLVKDGVEERVRVLDFGIAWVTPAPGQPKLTATGNSFGTPAYMSPEICAGKPFDLRADLYAIACTLHEMLTGAPPFGSSSSAEVMAAHLYRVPAPLTEAWPELNIPKALDEAVLRGLAKVPSERFASAAQMREALLESLHAPREGPLRGAGKKNRRQAPSPALEGGTSELPLGVLEPSGEGAVGLMTALGMLGFAVLPFHEEYDLSGFAAIILAAETLERAAALVAQAGKTPVLFCGPEDDSVLMAKAIEVGIYDYIPLPLDARDLKKKVERALRRRR
ncbi:MAG TPA: serine/threonine-protein kinase [Myxococcales bacterium]|jgi:serine/threonine-protein kinase|nr:serine/threonine-protein kinase [Myxococcales bacterium]